MTIVVYNVKGGVGKTTAALHLSHALARSGQPTLVWDLDPQGACSFALRVEAPGRRPDRPARPERPGLASSIRATDYPNLDVLPSAFTRDGFARQLAQLPAETGLRLMLEQLGRRYRRMVLDTPAGASDFTGALIRVADVLLVPTIPTVLSLRMLAQVAEYSATLSPPPRLLCCLNMVDRRRTLHRAIADWAASQPLIIGPDVPNASVVEQTTVTRAPVSATAPSHPVARAFENMVTELERRAAAPTDNWAAALPSFGDAIATLLETLTLGTSPVAHATPVEAGGADRESVEALAFELHLAGRDHVAALLAGLASRPVPEFPAVVHVFDTEDGCLRRHGSQVVLREQQQRFLVHARTPTAATPAEGFRRCEIQIDNHWAAQLLAERLSPLNVLERRVSAGDGSCIDRLRARIGERPLRRVATTRTWQQRLRVTDISLGDTSCPAVFEFSRSEDPDAGRRVVVTVTGPDSRMAQEALRTLFRSVHVPWQPNGFTSRLA